jgi:hypothetical protein
MLPASSANPGIRLSVLRQVPFPRFLHGVLEYAEGALFVVSPFLFAFDSGAATGIAIAVGVLLICIAASTAGPTGLIGQIPLGAHVTLDYLIGAVVIAMPFIAAFSKETAPTAFFIAVGVAHLLLTIGTRFRKPAQA